MRIPSGKTDAKIFFLAVDKDDLLTPLTGLTSFTVYRSRNGGTLTAYTTPTVTEIDNTNAPGVYALTVDEDTTLSGGAGSEEYYVRITEATMAPVHRTVEIYESSGGGGATAQEVWEYATRTLTALDEDSTTLDLDATIRAAVGLASANLDTQIGDLPTNAELATALAAADDATLAAIAALNDLTAAEVADAVWDALTADHNDANTFGEFVQSISGGGGPTAADIADAVWDEDATAHQTQGTFGQAIGDPGADTDTIFGLVNTNLNATVGSRASQTSVDDLPTNAELATALAGADDAVLAAIAALNNLSQANVRSAIGLASANLDTQLDALPTAAEVTTAVWAAAARTLTALDEDSTTLDLDSTIRGALGVGAANLDTQIGNLPTNAELATALAGADDAVLAAIAALNNLSQANVRTAIGLASANLDTQLAALPTAAENAAALLAEEVETGLTVLQSMRGFASIMLAPWSKAAGVQTWRDVNNTKDRVAATIGATSRGVPTLDLD